jgi:dTDP-4-dehydrorhamnose reductase
MKILITGGSGRFGGELVRAFQRPLAPGRDELDITDKESVSDYVRDELPDVLIHSAAFTDIRLSESEHETAWKINVTGTENLVNACLEYKPDTYFVYISTPCVFDGKKGMFTEDDVPAPVNYYSLTKLIGEMVAKRMLKHLIARTNFITAGKWPHASAFTDRYGTYLFAEGAARGIKEVVDKSMTGVVHIVGDKKMSMFDAARMTTHDVKPATLSGYEGPPLTVDMSMDTVRWKKYKIGRAK